MNINFKNLKRKISLRTLNYNCNIRNFSTLIVPDIINNSKIHNSVHHLSSAAENLGEKDVIYS